MLTQDMLVRDGTPLSAEEFLKQLVGSLPSLYKDVEQLRKIWKEPF